MTHRSRLVTLLVLLLLFTSLVPSALAAPPAPNNTALPEGPVVVRIYYNTPSDMALLHDYDVFEYNNRKEGYFLAAISLQQLPDLQKLGLRVQVDAAQTANFTFRAPAAPDQTDGIPGYACYRTVEETFTTASTIVSAHPTLASWVDAGDSWDKLTAGGATGYDMMVLKLTNSAIAGPKPKLLITASIHAREYTPAELTTRFAEYLINNYGTNADATWLLDHHEVHLMLHANPDGRKQAEAGLSWRKNTNQNYCGTTSTSRGADLNRNFAFQWGCCGGSSGSACSETYRGPSAASEPEVQTIQAYMRAIFPDQRGPLLTDPAPADATGVYLDIHSYSDLVLWPWGFTSTVPPNGTALQTLGRKFAYFNSYTPQQAIDLYATDGTTDDFLYGDLGVAAYTFELGDSFFQDCATFENTIVPANLPALVYAAKVARTPYLTAAGPDALTPVVAPATATAGDSVTLTASINDTRFNNSGGTEPTQAIAAAEYYLDTPPWQAGAVAYPLAASDGTFNSSMEAVTATINTAGLSGGRHIVFVRGKDAANNWGAFSAVFLDVTAFSVNPTSVAVCAPASAIYPISVGYAGSVTFSVSGNPAGSSTGFSPNPVSGPGSTTLTIGNIAAAAPGAYTLNVTGSYAAGSQTTPLALNIATAAPAAVMQTAPANGATNVVAAPTLTWNAVAQANGYTVQIATDAGFSNIVASASNLAATSFTPATLLNTSTRYYWRVWSGNACGAGAYSTTWSFTTVAAPGDCSPGSTPNVLFTTGFESGLAGWSTPAGIGTNTWALATANPHSGGQHVRGLNPATVSNQPLVSPAITLPTGQNPVVLKFWHLPNLENNGATACYDGGILEVSSNGGSTWTQVANANLLAGSYTGLISSSWSNPLAGRQGWCNGSTYSNVIADLSSYAGQTVQFRFSLGTDNGIGDTGWDVDDLTLQSCQAACPYDVNHDGRVDIVDVQLVAGAFGTANAAYDFNGSGAVDVADIQAAAEHWYVGC